MPHRNVLAVGLSPEEFDRLAPFLSRQSFEVDRFPSAVGALELVNLVNFELLLVRYPLPDMEMSNFLRSVRSDGSRCQSSSLLVLAPSDERDAARSYIGRGANRSLDLAASEAEIQESISSVLNVAPRKAARFLARFEIKIGGSTDMMLCQTENFSQSGMLIRSDRKYDKGTQIEFEFSLTEHGRPVHGVAEVVRHTLVGQEQVQGIGLRFLSWEGDSQRRFEAYLQTL